MTPLSREPAGPRPRGESIIIECELSEPPEKVWRALTEPDLLAAWLLTDGVLRAAPADGPRPPQADPGTLTPLTAEPHRRLSYRWSVRESRGAHERRLESELDFELTPAAGGGTHLRIVHDAFRESHVIRMSAGMSAVRQPQPFSAMRPVILGRAA
jgi:uncharacterized protein YndB with AHSA1/START domain